MGKYQKLLDRILRGLSDKDIPFEELGNLLLRMGFEKRVRGSHHLFFKAGVREMINLQREGHLAKSYQVRQIRNIIVQNKLEVE